MTVQTRAQRWPVLTTGVLTAGALTLLLAGCARPEGIDGDLTGEWSAMGEPVGFVPAAGTCHEGDYREVGTLQSYRPIDCAEEHVTEIVYVGEFDGEAGDRESPPEPGSQQWRDAFNACEDGAADYLGADYRYARLWLGVVVPSPQAWEGGARWLRCDVVQSENPAQIGQIRTGSLAGALADDSSELRLGCFEVTATDTDIERMDPVDCDQPHQAEFVGVWRAPDGEYPDSEDDESADLVHGGCRELIAEYVDLPVDDDLPFRTGTIVNWMAEQDWRDGDHGFRCYLWLSEDEIHESLRGDGPDALPVR